MKKKTSLKDIAEKAGVSITLVSYVLNNQKEGRISKEAARKIRAIAEELHYRPNHIAKSLKTNRTQTIGLVVADIANAFSSRLARIIEDEAEKNGYTVIFGSSDESAARADKITNVLLDHQVDGLILAPPQGMDEQVRRLQKQHTPLVLIDRYLPELKISYVAVDNFGAALEGTRHLLRTGRRRIGIIAFQPGLLHLDERERGYRAAFKEEKVPHKKSWVHYVSVDENTEAEVQVAIQKLLALPEPVDALFFASNKVSTFALKYLNKLSVRVPDDLAIVSFDQSDAAELFHASLTHIRQPLEEMGQQAVRILLAHIAGEKKITQLQLQTELVVGRSTATTKKEEA